ncbi:hypothetical protein [Mucilaginibacter glaciei]|uniref:Uncharacterized protein n=1 Tax=Mucilaginibacter glaciei TaxID=2772109 RepID=A0A926NTJ1_9SPHI|nr:hypothetical protein [Mucilaginibacter glaciei]MBD1395013.1 hypothetical protein [Mucilaginibacter glaciei]
MKRKEQILDSYYSHGADGMPEISAEGLLKAMDEYAEQAFNAARATTPTEHKYTTFTAYKAEIEKVAESAQSLTDKIKLIAQSILEQFIPDDPNAKSFSFDIKTNGIIYTVHYKKAPQGYWEFEKHSQR